MTWNDVMALATEYRGNDNHLGRTPLTDDESNKIRKRQREIIAQLRAAGYNIVADDLEFR